MNILNQLADHARERVKTAEKTHPFDEIKERALSLPKGDFAFEKALAKPGIRFICECKKASPSKGLIAPEFPYLEIARSYEKAGADAVSVLTEPKWFLGDDRYLKEIAAEVSIPCLRKDFTVDKYMIYEAKLLGAAAVLLICSILSAEELAEYLRICDELGISALVETHDAAEVSMALSAGGEDHRCKQPQSEGFFCGHGKQPPSAGGDSCRYSFRLGERSEGRGGRGPSAGHRRGRGAGGRSPHARA